MLDVSPEALEKLLAEKAIATVRLDRAEALVLALTQRLAMARDADARAARQAIHDDAAAKCEAIRSRLPIEYAHHALALRSLVRDLAEAEAARIRAMKEAPELPVIPSPEDVVRGLDAVPEEILDREEIELWVLDGRSDPLPDDRQSDVTSSAMDRSKGKLFTPSTQHVYGPALSCTLRRFTRIRYREAVAASNLDRLHRTVNLPTLFAYGDDFVTSEPFREVDTTLAYLSREMRPRPGLKRDVKQRLEPVAAKPTEPDAGTSRWGGTGPRRLEIAA
ncbi:hypothetical protein [Methylobacterium haplocladii]|uniref:Uncharacterized protein n=1 Tax=Methylobacterium haplocladii TaxID=1176176 RepID=A0A512IQR5_9HYPH|nr:hypothetical protein [Methylobacterium haplocladii]GEP00038.1 hypothetical protein MHA02_24250 [Methylobacterium haplocladii]GLS59860.1 hypothetical protein GCM10007887_25330 [Methylobacterium haplocladii]